MLSRSRLGAASKQAFARAFGRPVAPAWRLATGRAAGLGASEVCPSFSTTATPSEFPATASTASRGDYATLTAADMTFFREKLGDAGVLMDGEEEEMRRYNSDWMMKWVGRSRCVLKPASTAEVAEVMKYAHERNLAVVPQGGNTGLVGGSVPVHDEIVLSLLRMNQIEALDKWSGIVTCQSGVVLEHLDNYLADRGFMVPLDLGAKGTCTIGGNAATNAGGLRYLRYGSLRGNILGMEAVLADGTILDSLSCLRKDNTGYGLPQLFIGAEGTLGIITRLSLLVPSRPKAKNVALFGCRDFWSVKRAFLLARQNLGEILSAVEFADRAALDFVFTREGLRDPLTDQHPFYILIETSGMNEDHDGEKLHNFLEAAMHVADGESDAVVTDGVVAQDATQAAAIWRLREGISDSMTFSGYVYKYDVSLPLPRMYELVEDTRIRLKAHGVADTEKIVVGYGHLGDANLHLNVCSISGRNDEMLALLEPWLFEWVAGAKGSISAEHGLGQCKNDFLHLSKDTSAVNMMKQLKAAMDPKGILNPYKVLPGGSA